MKRKNALREARRSQHLTRMSRRTESVPTYKDYFNGKGEIERSVYLGHVLVPMAKVFQGTLSHVGVKGLDIDLETGKVARTRFASLAANIR